MKDIRHFNKKDRFDNRLEMTNHRVSVPQSKLSSGSITDKYPVVLDDGRTTIFISDKSREAEIRLRYNPSTRFVNSSDRVDILSKS